MTATGRRLLGGASLVGLATMLYSHLSVTILCINVAFDLVLLGLPIYALHAVGLLPMKLYLAATTLIINWTTPVVFAMPLVLSGSKVYCNDVDLLVECKSTNSLLLANHGSRVDWMVGMFVGFARFLAGRTCNRIRVGYVCEALIQFLPLVGWYRRLVARDVFVWRSFKQDAPALIQNIRDFHQSDERRMLFLSPEGVVCDFDEKSTTYIKACRQFCLDQNYEPFEYVLTPRYKGSMCLLEQVKKTSGPVVSVCLAFVRDGKLLNCSLLSPDRVVPDIYTLNQGISGSPVDIYIHLKRMQIPQDLNDPAFKTLMMENYKEKEALMAEWDNQTLAGTASSNPWMSKYTVVQGNKLECGIYQLGHAVAILAVALLVDRVHTLLRIFVALFCVVSGCHSLGLLLNKTSVESVPFETGIKSVLEYFLQRRKGKGSKAA